MRETKYWTWFMAAGVLIFVLLGLHMVVMHLGGLTHVGVAVRGEDSTTVANSHARDANLLFTVTYVLLLALALFHGLYGLRTVLFELTLKPALEKALTVFLLLLGIGLFGLGTWAAFAARAAALRG
jgi:succinate dehydrogenase hydrophobic anchor subunit